MKLSTIALFLSAGVSLTGCSSLGVGKSEYACPGMPNGVLCKTPREVYGMTNGDALSISGDKPTAQDKAKASIDIPPMMAMPTIDSAQNLPSNLPQPVLEPALAMRIWIAPWKDEKGDLNWPSYAFTEIRARKWTFGGMDFRGTNPIVPPSLYTIEQDQGKAIKAAAEPARGAQPANARSVLPSLPVSQ